MGDTLMQPATANMLPETMGAIDADVHPYFKQGLKSLSPYLSRAMRERMGLGPKPEYARGLAASEFNIPTLPYYIDGGNTRADSAPPEGGPPCSDPAFVVKDLIERYQLGAVILNGGQVLSLGGMPDPYSANAIAAAHNEWIAAEWLAHDKRFHGSILVAPRDVAHAVKEIERWANHSGMVQVLIPAISEHTFGQRHFWPIYEAATRNGLAVSSHVGGESAGINGSMMATLASGSFAEHWGCLPQVGQGQLTSLVLNGALEEFPTLRFVFQEYGFSWLQIVMWRLDAAWKAFRREISWVKKLPSEYIAEHCRFTTQPLDEPKNYKDLEDIIRMVQADRTLLFSTDYPHWDSDMPDRVQTLLPAAIRSKVFIENARDAYPRLRV
jgi:uncharacterized protein